MEKSKQQSQDILKDHIVKQLKEKGLSDNEAVNKANEMLNDPYTKELYAKSLQESMELENLNKVANTAKSLQGTDPQMLALLYQMIKTNPQNTQRQGYSFADSLDNIIGKIKELSNVIQTQWIENMLIKSVFSSLLPQSLADGNQNNKQDNEDGLIKTLQYLEKLGVLNNGNKSNDDDVMKTLQMLEKIRSLDPLSELAKQKMLKALESDDKEQQLLSYINELHRKIDELKNGNMPNTNFDLDNVRKFFEVEKMKLDLKNKAAKINKAERLTDLILQKEFDKYNANNERKNNDKAFANMFVSNLVNGAIDTFEGNNNNKSEKSYDKVKCQSCDNDIVIPKNHGDIITCSKCGAKYSVEEVDNNEH